MRTKPRINLFANLSPVNILGTVLNGLGKVMLVLACVLVVHLADFLIRS